MYKKEPKFISVSSFAPEYYDQDEKPAELVNTIPKFISVGLNKESVAEKPRIFPTSWAVTKSPLVELEPGNLAVSYQGPGKTDQDSCCIKSNNPINQECGIFYFEITIVSKGRDGNIAVGFSSIAATTNKLPGSDDSSWGYHAIDGKKFTGNTQKVYGPGYSTGDCIGCMLNYSDDSISFTRNGVLLGVAFKNVIRDKPNDNGLYACVGLRSPGETIKTNFGKEPFKFDIAQYFRDEKSRHWNAILNQKLAFEEGKTVECALLNRLVVEWLVKQGYDDAALDLYNHTVGNSDILDQTGKTFNDIPRAKSITARKHIITLINQGQIDQAISEINNTHRAILNTKISFMLHCLKFIETIRNQASAMVPDETVSESLVAADLLMKKFEKSGQAYSEAIDVSQILIRNLLH